MSVPGVLGRNDLQELLLHRERRWTVREPNTPRDAKDMRVHSHRRLAEGDVQNDIRRLAPDTRKFFQRLTIPRNLASVLANQFLRQGYDVLGLVTVQSDRFDRLTQTLLAKGEHFLRRIGDLEQ